MKTREMIGRGQGSVLLLLLEQLTSLKLSCMPTYAPEWLSSKMRLWCFCSRLALGGRVWGSGLGCACGGTGMQRG